MGEEVVPKQKVYDLEKRFNELSPAEDERLTLLMEECAEVIQAIGKIKRHGYKSFHPSGGPDNRENLEMELGDVMHIIDRMVRARDISRDSITAYKNAKADRIGKYLHHQ